MFYAVRNGKTEIIEYLIKNGSVNLLREDNKGQNLIQYAAKYKLYTVVEFLMKAGVPCPPDIKRKLERNNSRLVPSRRKDDKIDDDYGNEMSRNANDNPNGKISDGNFGDIQSVIQTLTPLQIKEFQKINQENKMRKKYTLTVLKDGIFQELQPKEFELFVRDYPVVADVLLNPEKLKLIPEPRLVDQSTPLYDSWDKTAKRLIN